MFSSHASPWLSGLRTIMKNRAAGPLSFEAGEQLDLARQLRTLCLSNPDLKMPTHLDHSIRVLERLAGS